MQTRTEDAIQPAKERLRTRVGRISRRFLGFGLKGQMLCAGSFLLGYILPVAGVALFCIQRHQKREAVWQFFSLAGPIFAMVIYIANYAFCVATGTL